MPHLELSHSSNYHPWLPSFRDEYRNVDAEIVELAYQRLFAFEEPKYITGGIATQFYF